MHKLNITQIMHLASTLEKTEWISVLMTLNNSGQIEHLFETIGKTDLLRQTLQDTKTEKTR